MNPFLFAKRTIFIKFSFHKIRDDGKHNCVAVLHLSAAVPTPPSAKFTRPAIAHLFKRSGLERGPSLDDRGASTVADFNTHYLYLIIVSEKRATHCRLPSNCWLYGSAISRFLAMFKFRIDENYAQNARFMTDMANRNYHQQWGMRMCVKNLNISPTLGRFILMESFWCVCFFAIKWW